MGRVDVVTPRPVVRPAYLRDLPGDDVVASGDPAELAALVQRGGVVVLSGAGLSTESGIPDYRGPSGALRRHTPMTYQEFAGSPDGRRRYWARSFIGWRHVAKAAPNAGHHAVARLESAGLAAGVVTQNVDGLHTQAGSRRVVDLHGSLDRVVCLTCGALSPRRELDDRLRAANPEFEWRLGALARRTGLPGQTAPEEDVNPDGDVDLPDFVLADFAVVPCLACGSASLKPDVVFFGETVPRERVEQCSRLVDAARALLVLGSSLTVMSGYRFVLRAAERGIPVAIVNRGPTRGDSRATLRLDADLGDAMTRCLSLLGLRGAGQS
jgi:NAD-dependent SIR2 family protein deacetylase